MSGRDRRRLAGVWLDLLCGRLPEGEPVQLPVLSGSMRPFLVPGRRVEIVPASWKDCRIGDIIVIRERSRLAAHRLLFRLSFAGRGWFLQKGDTNRAGGWVSPRQVAGIVVRAEDAWGRLRDFRAPEARALARRCAARQLRRALFWTLYGSTAVRRLRRWFRRVFPAPAITGGAGPSPRAPLAPNGRDPAGGSEYRLPVGEAVMALQCPSEEQAGWLSLYFGIESSRREPGIRLKLAVVPDEGAREIPDSLFLDKQVSAGRFSIAGGVARGCYSAATGTGELQVQASLLEQRIRVFEQLLYQAYYSARERGGEDAFLVHSCGVIRNGAGFLFVGRSGSGKSTVAGLSLAGRPGCRVLNDEICLVRFTGGEVSLHGTPFNGFFTDKTQGHAPLRAVFLLRQAGQHRLAETDRKEAALQLYSQIVPPLGLDGALTPAVRETMFDLAGRLMDRVPVRRLDFLPDPGFWDQIDEEYGS